MEKEIIAKLKAAGTHERIASAARFFREPAEFWGLTSAEQQKIAKTYFKQIDAMAKRDVFALAESLYKYNRLESTSMASEFVYRKRADFTKSDFKVFQKWCEKYFTNWAMVDVFFNHSMADLIEKFPDLVSELKRWTASKNRWVKRAAAVTFILPARSGKFHDDVFEIADALLTDTDDMVQKGYGWALKAVGESDPKRVLDFVVARVQKMPRTAYRYAIEKLPNDMKKRAMTAGK